MNPQMTLEEAVVIKNKRIQLACLKAYGELTIRKMGSQTWGSFCMLAVNAAAQILTHFDEPFTIVTGYFHLIDPATGEALHPYSYAHAWLESGIRGLVTDLTFSEARRQVMIMGMGVAVVDYAIKPTYTTTPQFPVYRGEPGRPALPLEVLSAETDNIKANLPRPKVPDFLKDEFDLLMQSALDPSPKLNIAMPEGLAASIAAANAGLPLQLDNTSNPEDDPDV